jgi:hypothetical protein
VPRFSGAGRRQATDHHVEQPAGQHRMPQAVPSLHQGPHFAGMRLPTASFAG